MSKYTLSSLPEWKAALRAVEAEPGDLQLWESLIAITIQYGTDSIKDVRQVFDKLLARFPLLFGYWIQYARLEVDHGKRVKGDDGGSATSVYERAVAAFPTSFDLWTQYGTYLIEAKRPRDEIRSVFDRGVNSSGRDFLAHPLWDAYIDFEDSIEKDGINIAKLLKIVIKYPMHQYARYYERCSNISERYPQVFEDVDLQEVFANTQTGTNDRWAFESQIARTYFHVIDLEPDQIANWNNYLDYEQSQGDLSQIQFLYERALVPCALYEEFWLRYVRWASVNVGIEQANVGGKVVIDKETVENIYRRATYIFIPLTRPHMRIHWSLYEESQGNVDFARDILQSYQSKCPIDLQEEVYYARIQFERRQSVEGGIEYINKELKSEAVKKSGKLFGLLLSNEALLTSSSDNVNKTRELFEKNKELEMILPSASFFINYFKFELTQAKTNKSLEHIHPLWKFIVVRTYLAPLVIEDISKTYLEFLQNEGFYKEQIEVDVETNGPFSVQKLHRLKIGGEDYVNKRLKLSNGHPGVEIDMISVNYEGKDPLEKYLRDQV